MGKPADAQLLTDQDLYLFNEGNHVRLYKKLGAHLITRNGTEGTHFAVWAPNASSVTVIGDFNGWNKTANPLTQRGHSGIWEGFVAGVKQGNNYKYQVTSKYNGFSAEKADPYAFASETPPKTASVVWQPAYEWGDAEWMKNRGRANGLKSPVSIYEVHLGSWMRVPEEGNRSLSYAELADKLTDYVRQMGFTHIELMPITEHPFYGSWGYQTTGYFSPTGRYGKPEDLMLMIDRLHQNGIGVIMDWVPAHFPTDAHGLEFFDGTHLYEHADPRQGFHPDWKSSIFNFGRKEVKSFLLSSALYWLDKYHADGLRVDAVASMLYLDYSRKKGEWIPNRHGGNENLEAIAFLKQFNHVVYENYPDVQTYAEESTAWPMVSRPTYLGGLGFGLKWDMGWMHDTLNYLARDPVFRKYHHTALNFRMLYAFGENYVLPLSHDEVAHGKGSLLKKMSGTDWQKFANLRLLFGSMFAQPGQKLVFMGGEFAQWKEWNHDASLDWHETGHAPHSGMQNWVRDLNRLYRSEPALHELNCSNSGFEWVDANDSQQSTLAYLRKAQDSDEVILAVCNFTPVTRLNYKVGVPQGGFWKELLNSDASGYWGGGLGNMGGTEAKEEPYHGRAYSLDITLPPLSIIFFKPA
ncbi:MAG TPA: 1,4-alpha-glucan branching protein GlgB [Elusimicrobiales bacterium]|nr:1,4-alpha-glucan branching protein GlgB [Elusimicrobiales bacterium]